MRYNQLEILNLFRRQESLDNLLEKTVCIAHNLFKIYGIFAFHCEINMSSTNYVESSVSRKIQLLYYYLKILHVSLHKPSQPTRLKSDSHTNKD